jgi:hypothetical protein
MSHSRISFLQPSAPEKIGLVADGEIKYPNANKQTCHSTCYEGYTTNGEVAETYVEGSTTEIDWSKTYYSCERCDIPCDSCAGAGPWNADDDLNFIGVEDDKFKCLTCSSSFPYLVDENEDGELLTTNSANGVVSYGEC